MSKDIRDEPVTLDVAGIRWTMTYIKGKGHAGHDQIEVVGMHPAMQGEVFRRKFEAHINVHGGFNAQSDYLAALLRDCAKSIGLKADA